MHNELEALDDRSWATFCTNAKSFKEKHGYMVEYIGM
jgi:hypothetical protein